MIASMFVLHPSGRPRPALFGHQTHSTMATDLKTTNSTGTVCFGQLCEGDDECCHDMDFGVPYCCSRYTGFIYLGLMLGGGLIVAILVMACFIVMRRTERELEAAAKLEAAKAVNSLSSLRASELSISSVDTEQTDTDSGEGEGDQHRANLTLPPPAYNDVVRAAFNRCHSCDVTMSPPVRDEAAMAGNYVRQHSEGSHSLHQLPPLVDITAFLDRHRREAEQYHERMQSSGLPPLPPPVMETKLPTYEECVARYQNTHIEEENLVHQNLERTKELQQAHERLGIPNSASRSFPINHSADTHQEHAVRDGSSSQHPALNQPEQAGEYSNNDNSEPVQEILPSSDQPITEGGDEERKVESDIVQTESAGFKDEGFESAASNEVVDTANVLDGDNLSLQKDKHEGKGHSDTFSHKTDETKVEIGSDNTGEFLKETASKELEPESCQRINEQSQ